MPCSYCSEISWRRGSQLRNLLERPHPVVLGEDTRDTRDGECISAFRRESTDSTLYVSYIMAFGPSPPQLLRRAKSVPPNKIERSSWGQVPASSRLMTAVVVFSSPGPASGSPISSAMCWGRSPSGPPAEPMGKERIIELIIDSVVWKAVYDVEQRMAGRSDDGAGCFCRRSCSVSSFIGAGGSSEP